MKVERNRAGNKYTFTPEDKEDEKFLDKVNKKIDELEEENKKLNIKVASLEGEIKGLNYTIEKLREENQTLELWLDNKEKLNEEYRKLIDKLKSDLGECECSFGFEADEVGFWKGEYKRLKKWIKDHCKGYGNLFLEDEMKRQRKKADKKRKKETLKEELISRIRQPQNTPYGKGVAELMEEDEHIVKDENTYRDLDL